MPIYNFSSGPATLPESVLRTAQQEMLDYNGTGLSVMTMSHRSDAFLSILHHAEQDLRNLMNIPSHYKILFLQGGALAQFTQVALNLAQGHQRADAVITGNWSRIAAEQMGKLSPHLNVHIAAHGGEQFNYTNLPAPETWDISPQSAFVHYVINETAHGVQYHPIPKLGNDAPPVVCDFSSEILSRPINVSDFGVIYAGAQKNIGMAGATVVIIREDLLARCTDRIPNVWNYQVHLDRNGMYNTPCTYAVYIAGLVFRWLQTQGGVAKMQAINEQKATLPNHRPKRRLLPKPHRPRSPLAHERDFQHGQPRARRAFHPRSRAKRHAIAGGLQNHRRHARQHLQRHAARRRGNAGELYA